MSNDCLFCRIIDGQIPSKKVAESDTLYAFEDINPQAPTHVLIVTKKHLADNLALTEADEKLVGSVFTFANRIARERGLTDRGFRIVTNCGEGAGQSVFHLHFHLLGGRSLNWPPG